MQEERDNTAIEVAKIYLSASKIQFGALQSLCVNKLRLLYPLSTKKVPTVIMIITRTDSWGCEAEEDVRDWLVDHVAHHFWDLVQTEPSALSRLMMENDVLRKEVIAKMAEDPLIGLTGMEF